jgi:uncharacterized peroxidase-related enzyme
MHEPTFTHKEITMTSFTVHTIESAPEASQAALQATQKAWGFVPTLHGTLAESPVALSAYTAMYGDITTRATLSPQEQQVAFQAVNVLHGCEYCTAGHTHLSRAVKLPEDVIQALRDSRPILSNARLQALREFTEAVVRERGMAGDHAMEAFYDAGFTQAQVLEVVTIVACKTISNYTNHLTHTPHESFMSDASLRWVAPSRRFMASAEASHPSTAS